MALPSKINKENFRLLDLSSDEESEDLQLEIIPSRKKKITRRERSRGPTKPQEPNLGAEVQCALRWAVRGTLLLWLLMLTWICAALYDQVTTMRADIAKVSTSSGSVDDALQVCHTAAKELRANASELSSRLFKLESEHDELARRVEKATSDLATVTSQLSAAPKLADTPRMLNELQQLVANFGSQIKDFESTVSSAHKQAVAATGGVEEVKKLVQALDARNNETIANVTANMKRQDELKEEISALNTTLVARMDGVQNRIEEINKPTSTLAPVVPTSTVANATTAAATPTSAPAPPGPAKPSVLGIGQ